MFLSFAKIGSLLELIHSNFDFGFHCHLWKSYLSSYGTSAASNILSLEDDKESNI